MLFEDLKIIPGRLITRLITILIYSLKVLLKFLKIITVDKYIESDDIDIFLFFFYFSISLFQLEQGKCMNRDMENVTSTCSSCQISMGVCNET